TITFSILIPAPLMSFLYTFMHKPKDVDYSLHTIHAIESLITAMIQQIWTIITLPYEAYQNVDAILRTIWRVLISHRHLLQWDPFTIQSEYTGILVHFRKMWFAPIASIAMMITLPLVSMGAFLVSLPLLLVWTVSPFLAWIISVPQLKKQTILTYQQLTFLRKISRKTWAYFEHFIVEEDHYLPPDNYQEYPSPRTAHRTSPTNIGVSLLSVLAAYDFGYISLSGLLDQCKKTLDTLSSLDRYQGHFYNWYDTQSLLPLMPRYVSTVDSGNLAACLLTLKQGLATLKTRPVISLQVMQGMKDMLGIIVERKNIPDTFKKLMDDIQAGPNQPVP
ncbi:MAG TPA: hypothetical protein VN763_12245, partial [Saprospiraceae bacterium]|nr:hypothetical protein [Saprospiraceae bacterium]